MKNALAFLFTAVLSAQDTDRKRLDTIEIPEYGLTIPVEIPAEQPPEMECSSKHNIIIDGHKWKGYQICTKVKYL